MASDKELLLAMANSAALSVALTATADALNAAHQFIDIITHEDSASVLSPTDEDLAEAVHTFIIKTDEAMTTLGEELETAIEQIQEMPDDGTAPTDDGTDLPGQYL